MSPLEAFLAPLARLATRFPDAEGAVLWADGGTWQAQDDTTERLDAEEIAFYAEGLLETGFHLAWVLLADEDAPAEPLILQLTCAEGAAPPRPPLPDGWCAAVPSAAGSARP